MAAMPERIFPRYAAAHTKMTRSLPIPPAPDMALRWGTSESPAPKGISQDDAMNDNEQRNVTIITGRAFRRKGGESEGVHIFLVAPDDDTAVKMALQSLAAEGYAEAELDQIGDMDGMPEEEPHASAYQGALEGEVAIVTFDEPF
jgi:hypothetical protein